MPLGDTVWLNGPNAANAYAANGSSINVTFPVYTTWDSTLPPPFPLRQIGDISCDQDFRRRRDRTPLEWLHDQIDEVCLLARAA